MALDPDLWWTKTFWKDPGPCRTLLDMKKNKSILVRALVNKKGRSGASLLLVAHVRTSTMDGHVLTTRWLGAVSSTKNGLGESHNEKITTYISNLNNDNEKSEM